MLPLRFVGVLVILLVVQASCKPAKSSLEGDVYSDDDPSDYNDDNADAPEESEHNNDEPPQIISKPLSIRARNGSTIWLPCLAKNTDDLVVMWKKDEDILYYDSIMMTTNQRIERLQNNTLVIHDARINDTSNNYECSVLYTTPISIKHRVLVEPWSPPPSPKSPIRVFPGKRVEVNAGENVTLGCESTMQQPVQEVKWYHENNRIHNKVIVFGNRITITNVNRHDGGRYRCLLENGSEKPPVEAINVVVNYAPEIETIGKWVHSGLEVESRLTCIVHAHPHANVAWYKNEEKVEPRKDSVEMKVNKTRHVLEILHTKKEDFGEYTCVAENQMGRAEKTVSLTGIPSQAIISGGELTKTATGLILKWQLESYSPITEYKLEYRRKGDEQWTVLKPTVRNGKGNQFTVEHTIEGLQPGSYEAILMARNDFGWSQPSKPHVFVGEYKDEEPQNVKGPGSTASQPSLAIATLFLVVSSCAFTSL